ncbi:MAG TPA: hypothetical protein DDW31_03090 [candidate division Zixibacteria bacterium]|nr:hypothetical protein [candidate division Zixibacteria bacterium]
MKRMPLAAAGVGLYLGLLLLHNLLIVAFTGPALKRQYSQDAFAFARMSARTVAEAYDSYYASGYYKFREMVGEVMRMNPDLLALALVDVEGRVLFDSREFDEGKPDRPGVIDNPEMLAAVKGLDITCRMTRGEDGSGRLDIVVPYLEEWGRHRVSVRYIVSYRSWADQWRGLWARILLAGLVSLALGTGIILLACSRLNGSARR